MGKRGIAQAKKECAPFEEAEQRNLRGKQNDNVVLIITSP